MSTPQDDVEAVLADLEHAARVAAVMVDGDQAGRIITDRAAHYIVNPDPAHRHLSGDHYDVDHDTFVRMKKTLLRLERLTTCRCNATLWVRVRGAPHLVTVAVQNGSLHRYYRFGEEQRAPTGEMAQCLASGCVVVVPAGSCSEYLTALAPVRDSLDDVVACVELTAAHPDALRPAPAWS